MKYWLPEATTKHYHLRIQARHTSLQLKRVDGRRAEEGTMQLNRIRPYAGKLYRDGSRLDQAERTITQARRATTRRNILRMEKGCPVQNQLLDFHWFVHWQHLIECRYFVV